MIKCQPGLFYRFFKIDVDPHSNHWKDIHSYYRVCTKCGVINKKEIGNNWVEIKLHDIDKRVKCYDHITVYDKLLKELNNFLRKPNEQ